MNQHKIPKFLLNKFAVGGSDREQVWLYQKDNEPRLELTKNVFCESDFYTLPGGELIIENSLSKFESKADRALNRVLGRKQLDDRRISTLNAFIYNLTARGYIFNVGKDYAKKKQKEFEDVLATIDKLPDLDLTQRNNIKVFTDKDPSYFEKQALLQFMPIIEAELIKNAGILENFKWELICASKDGFILGDTGVVWFPETDSDSNVLPLVDANNLKFVALPLSSEIGLVGRHPSCKADSPTVEEINERSALTCFSSFISSKKTATLETLHNKIGTDNLCPSSATFFEWITKENIKNNQPIEADPNRTFDATFDLNFQEDRLLVKKDRDLFFELANNFKLHAKSLSLAEHFHVRCTFTDNVAQTLKHLNRKNAVKLTPPSNYENVWLHEVITQPQSTFHSHIIINTNHYVNSEQDRKISFLYYYFLELFLKASSSRYVQIKRSPETDPQNYFIIQTLQKMESVKTPTSLSYELFQQIFKDQNSKLDETENNLVLDSLKRRVSFCLNLLAGRYTPRQRIYQDNHDITPDVIERLAEEIPSCICVSLAGYFAVATSKQREELFHELRQRSEFKFILEKKWKNMSELLDEDGPMAQAHLSIILENISFRSAFWLYTLLRDLS